MTDLVARVGRICGAFPEVSQRLSHSTPTWFIRDKKTFVMLWPDGHHDDAVALLWCAAPAGEAAELIASQPAVYYYPPYVGHRGWVGVRLADVDWTELAEVLEDAYRTVAPKTLIAALDAARSAS
jgi:hypothetical protein